ncbi:MAG TPA: hypothetical protein VMT17_06610 [Anaeromyxobacteraceae bacterium]|nr:hypothetical protein [Anaeromyxobacteraceae bacterium]
MRAERPPQGRRRARGAGKVEEGTSVFICPVCAERLVSERGLAARPCAHVLLVRDRSGLAYFRDEGVRSACAKVARHLDPGDRDAQASLQRSLGPRAVFFDLLEDAAGAPALTLAIDLGARP